MPGRFGQNVALVNRRLQRLALVIPIGLVVGVIVLLATSHGLRTVRGGRIGGDLPAFYGAARIVRSGDATRLYDWRAQRAAERDLLPESEQGWIPFAYPPFVAVAYVPFTLLPFKWAYAAHTIGMVALCAIAVVLACRLTPGLQEYRVSAVAAALGFYPLFRAVLGGQNTSISLMCAAGAAAALARQNALGAGVWIGVWMFKPQLALPVAAMIAWRSRARGRFLIGIAISTAAYYAVATAVAGPGWPWWWWRQGALPFGTAERVINQENVISFAELGSAFAVRWLGWTLAALTAAFAVWLAARRRELPPLDLVAIASATAVLIAPHALYYDAGLASLALIASAARSRGTRPVIVALWVIAWAQPFRSALPVPPLTVVLAGALWLMSRPADGSGRRVGAAELGEHPASEQHRALQ